MDEREQNIEEDKMEEDFVSLDKEDIIQQKIHDEDMKYAQEL